MAARVAAQLSNESDVKVETARGGLGEFSVSIDGQKILATSRFWYPTLSKVMAKTRARLAERPS